MSSQKRGLIKEQLELYKCKKESSYLICIPVLDDKGNIKAYLRPITKDYLKTIPECVELMSRWREENPSIATGTFKITHERTKQWLDKFVVDNDNRIIFLISDFHGRYIGHIGLASFDEESKIAEIDSVLRGEKNCISGLMQFSMKAIMNWGRDVLKLENYYLKVFSDNEHAINFYKKCGFKNDILLPLVKVTLQDEEKWELSEDIYLKDAERYYLKMILEGE